MALRVLPLADADGDSGVGHEPSIADHGRPSLSSSEGDGTPNQHPQPQPQRKSRSSSLVETLDKARRSIVVALTPGGMGLGLGAATVAPETDYDYDSDDGNVYT
jgi:hypothetical protein